MTKLRDRGPTLEGVRARIQAARSGESLRLTVIPISPTASDSGSWTPSPGRIIMRVYRDQQIEVGEQAHVRPDHYVVARLATEEEIEANFVETPREPVWALIVGPSSEDYDARRHKNHARLADDDADDVQLESRLLADYEPDTPANRAKYGEPE